MNKIATGTKVIAQTAIMGAKRGCGWHYAEYEADASLLSGYRFSRLLTSGMYPNKSNATYSAQIEADWKASGMVVVCGRPHQGQNAPEVA